MSSGYTTKQDGIISGNNIVPWMGRQDYVDIRPGLLTREIVETSPFINFRVKKIPVYFDPAAQCVARAQQMLAKAKTEEEQMTAQALFDSLVNPETPAACSTREPDSYAIVREDSGSSLGTVGNRYFPVQNSEGLDI